MPAHRRLGRRAAYRYGDLFAGITGTSEGPEDPWATLNLNDTRTGEGDIFTVRPGDTVHAGRYTLTFTEVVPGARDGYVTFTVEGPGSDDAKTE
ncbi:hypothetical protein [Streptomyces sp. NPDC021020]|uniref:hypothetical protein n=1 Tax=Streptomyces sp. NPDC021020 TaxID=3365109 RepID=UPI0037BC1D8F